MKKYLLGFLAGLALTAGAAMASVYYGYDPTSGAEGTHGVLIDGGQVLPVLSGTCGTRSAQLGGAVTGVFTAGAVTTCTTTVTFAVAAPNGYLCEFKDITTPADTVRQASYTSTSATTGASTIVSGDQIGYTCRGF